MYLYVEQTGITCGIAKCAILNNINPFPNLPLYLRVCSTSVLKRLWEKEESLKMSDFSLSHSVFFSLRKLSAIFMKLAIIVVCKLFESRRVLTVSLNGKELRVHVEEMGVYTRRKLLLFSLQCFQIMTSVYLIILI